MKEFAVGGWYSFLTYAALHWADHLEHWVENCGDAQAVKKIEQQIRDFLQKHWSKANLQIAISKNLRQKFKLFQECDIFDSLLRAISVWKKQCTSFGLSSAVPEELELLEHIIQPRRALELLSGSATENQGLQRKLSTYYGHRLYKCPRLSCNFFTEGFKKISQRDFHLKKHDRGFTCTYPSCPYGILGVKTKSELEKHITSHCSRAEAEIESFPVTRDPKSIDIKQAIRYSLEEEIERWLQQFGGIYDRKSYDSGVFLPVIAKGDVAIVDIFLKHAGGITASDLSELCNLAMRAQQDDIAIHFLCHKLGDPLQPAFRDQRPGNLCSQPALVAIYYGRAKVLRYMIQNCDIKPNTRTSNQPSSSLLFEAFASRRLEIIDTLVATNGRYTDTLERNQNVAAALCMAIEKGDEDVIREMVGHRDCNLDFPTENGTPIHLAIQCRSATIVKILLETGKCDINVEDTTGRTPLRRAAQSCQEDIILQLLKDPNCDVNEESGLRETVLYSAIMQESLAIVDMVLESGRCNVNVVDTQGNTPLHTVIQRGSTKMCRMLLKTGECNINIANTLGDTPLHTAVRRDSIQICGMLLKTGECNVNVADTWGNTPLHTAMQCRSIPIFEMLLETGECNVNVADTWGNTPLHTSIQYKHTQMFKMILKTGKCNVNIGNNIGDTPLHEACRCGHEYIISLLLKVTNCDMNVRNKAERTAFHEAINSGHFSVANMLLGTGKCNIDTRDTLGNTPLDTAVTHNREGIRRHLKEDISRSNSAENSVISIISMLFGCGKYDDFSNDDYLLDNHVFEILLEIDSLKTGGQWDPIRELFKAVNLGRTARVKILLAKGEIPAGRIVVSLSTGPHFGTFYWVHSYDENPDTGVLTDQGDIIRLLTLDMVNIEEKFNVTKHHSLSPPAGMTHDDINHLSSPFQYSDGSLEKLSSQDVDNVFMGIGDQQVCEHKDIIEGVCFDCWMTFLIDYMPPALPTNPIVVPPLDITPKELNS
jgi:ankyrin repeat protein